MRYLYSKNCSPIEEIQKSRLTTIKRTCFQSILKTRKKIVRIQIQALILALNKKVRLLSIAQSGKQSSNQFVHSIKSI